MGLVIVTRSLERLGRMTGQLRAQSWTLLTSRIGWKIAAFHILALVVLIAVAVLRILLINNAALFY